MLGFQHCRRHNPSFCFEYDPQEIDGKTDDYDFFNPLNGLYYCLPFLRNRAEY